MMLAPPKDSKHASRPSPRLPRRRLSSYEIQSEERQMKQQWSEEVSSNLHNLSLPRKLTLCD